MAIPSRDTGDREDAGRGRAGRPEDAGTFRHGGAGGEDVVDKQHVAVGKALGPDHHERVSQVPPALLGVEVGLSAGGALPPEPLGLNRYPPSSAHATGQESGLVEPALGLAGWMERDRDEAVDLPDGEHRARGLRHQITERTSHGGLPPEFQAVERLPHPLPVERRRTRVREERAPTVAGLAAGPHLGAIRLKARERAAAGRTVGRREPLQPLPACPAERIPPTVAEARVAEGAKRGKEEIEERGDQGREVFQRPQSGQRSRQWEWRIPQAEQR